MLDALIERKNGLATQPLIQIIDRLEEDVKGLEDTLEAMTAEDRMVELLMTIPGCGKISAWTIRAYTDDITRYANPKKYAGLASWVQVNAKPETVRHGKITKRGPEELRTAIAQVVE